MMLGPQSQALELHERPGPGARLEDSKKVGIMENKIETTTVYWLGMRAKNRDSAGKMYPSCEAVSRMLRGCFYRMVCLLFFANETNGSEEINQPHAGRAAAGRGSSVSSFHGRFDGHLKWLTALVP